MLKHLTNPDIFPVVMMALYVLASIRYGIDGDWRRVIYWACAFGLNFVVTFDGK